MTKPAETPLRQYRRSRTPKLTLRELSELVGVTEGQMSRIERDGTDSLRVALKLAELTGLPVAAFAKKGEPSKRGKRRQ